MKIGDKVRVKNDDLTMHDREAGLCAGLVGKVVHKKGRLITVAFPEGSIDGWTDTSRKPKTSWTNWYLFSYQLEVIDGD